MVEKPRLFLHPDGVWSLEYENDIVVERLRDKEFQVVHHGSTVNNDSALWQGRVAFAVISQFVNLS